MVAAGLAAVELATAGQLETEVAATAQGSL